MKFLSRFLGFCGLAVELLSLHVQEIVTRPVVEMHNGFDERDSIHIHRDSICLGLSWVKASINRQLCLSIASRKLVRVAASSTWEGRSKLSIRRLESGALVFQYLVTVALAVRTRFHPEDKCDNLWH